MTRLWQAILVSSKVRRRVRLRIHSKLFGTHGTNFSLDPDGIYSHRTIFVGNSVSLGLPPVMIAALSQIRIGNSVMFGPRVVVIGGGHGRRPADGRGLSLREDWTRRPWRGSRGRRGGWGRRHNPTRSPRRQRAAIGASSVATKDDPAYAGFAGDPAGQTRFRWDVATIVPHGRAYVPGALPLGCRGPAATSRR
jgi:acetyltransferase-like isoleucine patch superfamily enzyme